MAAANSNVTVSFKNGRFYICCGYRIFSFAGKGLRDIGMPERTTSFILEGYKVDIEYYRCGTIYVVAKRGRVVKEFYSLPVASRVKQPRENSVATPDDDFAEFDENPEEDDLEDIEVEDPDEDEAFAALMESLSQQK